MDFAADIKKIIEGDIDGSSEALEIYSHDASLFTVVPKLVVFPKHSDDVKKIVKYVGDYNKKNPAKKLSITARSAGTCMSGGAINNSIILDFTKYMNHLGEVNVENKTLTTEPGVFYRDFEKATLAKNLMYPTYPASKEICAMGGIVGNNGAGEKSLRYGKAENYVIETKVVFTDGNEYVVKPLNKTELDAKMVQGDFEGNVYKSLFDMIDKNYEAIKNAKPNVSKNSAGYYLWNVYDKKTGIFDLNKLIVGSQGTLGIVTSATFKLVDVEPYSNLLVIFMDSIEKVGDLAAALVKYNPDSVESFDDYSLKLAVKYFGDFFKEMGFFHAVSLGFRFIPEMIEVARNGVPKLIVLVEVCGNSAAEVSAKLLEIQNAIKPFGFKNRITRSRGEAEKYWDIRRDSFNLLRHHVKNKRTAPFIDDIIVRPEFLPEFMPKLEKMLNDQGFIYTVAGHVGNGNFHIIPLMDMHDPKSVTIITELSDKVYDLVLSYKGSITAEHNDGIIRTPYLEKMYGPFIVGLFKLTKSLFDPNTIFNPGKKVGDTKEYLKEHIAVEK